jgi:antitoxin (DNA-binding transcriptional repressor) of toxin-antitoxin stability system
VPKRTTRKPPEELVREHPAEYRAARKVSATEASRNFSEILNRIRYRGESFIVMRGGQPICELRPAVPTLFTGVDLVTLFRSLPAVDEDYLSAVEEAAQSQPLLPESPWVR